VDSMRIISGSEDGTIRIWDGKKGILLNSWEGHSQEVTSIVWNHDGTKLASGSTDMTIKIWEGANYTLLMTLEGHSYPVRIVTWNHDSSRILTVAAMTYVQSEFFLWDGMTGEGLKTAILPLSGVCAAVWNHDSSKLLVAGTTRDEDGVIVLWDGKMLTEERRLVYADGSIFSVCWNHDSTKIISSHEEPIQIWDVESGALLNSFTGHFGHIWTVFWSHDGSKIWSGSEDGTIRIWDGATRQLLMTGSFGASVHCMRLTNDEDRIAFPLSGFLRCLTVTNL
jgi:WD40 repeat protein